MLSLLLLFRFNKKQKKKRKTKHGKEKLRRKNKTKRNNRNFEYFSVSMITIINFLTPHLFQTNEYKKKVLFFSTATATAVASYVCMRVCPGYFSPIYLKKKQKFLRKLFGSSYSVWPKFLYLNFILIILKYMNVERSNDWNIEHTESVQLQRVEHFNHFPFMRGIRVCWPVHLIKLSFRASVSVS